MQVSGPYIHALRFDSFRITQRYVRGEGKQGWIPTNGFSHPLTEKKRPKLYVFSDGQWPYYIGITRQSLSTRLRMGFKASRENRSHGYGGYAFKNHVSAAILHVWVEEGKMTGTPDDSTNMETVEAELVYRIRKTGSWPKYQTEIHFSPFESFHTDVADEIFRSFSRLKRKPLSLPA